MATVPGNWHRWGPEDERGALNWIRPDQIVRAAQLVSGGRVYPMAIPIGRETPVPAERPRPLHFMDRDGGDYAAGGRRPGGFQFSEDTLLLASHTGTHVDALAHCWTEDQLYNGFPGNSIRSTTGARHCGIDKMGPIATRGVLLDIAGFLGVAHLAAGYEVAPELMASCAEAEGIAIGQGDAVLIRTGWQNTAPTQGPDYFRGEPGLGISGAEWLAERRVAAVGADNYALEVLPSPGGSVFPVHLRLLRDYGTPIIEGLVLDALADEHIKEFLFVAAPLPIAGGVGSPLMPIAIV